MLNILRRVLKKNKETYLITSIEDLSHVKDCLKSENIFCIDTEFDWRTTYFPKLSTLQLGFSKKIFIFDCLSFNPSRFLKKYMEDSSHLKILHSVRSDATVIKNCLGLKINNVFDIQIAEKEISKEGIKNYASIVGEYFSVNLDKAQTNSNWLKRPLTSEQLKYAYEDVDFLIEIYQIQRRILSKKNILKKIFHLSQEEAEIGNEDLKITRFNKRKNKMKKKEKEVFLWRENLAIQRNVPPNYIIKENKISYLCKLSPNDKDLKKKVIKITGDSYLSDEFIEKFYSK